MLCSDATKKFLGCKLEAGALFEFWSSLNYWFFLWFGTYVPRGSKIDVEWVVFNWG
jgi:hypothetical protein